MQIQEELEKERNKSLVDEATIRKLEEMLSKRVQELDSRHNDMEQAAEKIQVAEEELNFLKNQLDNERRKSTVDQNKLRKFEAIIAEKQKKL